MEDFLKSIRKSLETLPGFNFLNSEEEEKENPNVNEGSIDEKKYDKLVNNANENKKNKNTRKRKPLKSKTKSRIKQNHILKKNHV